MKSISRLLLVSLERLTKGFSRRKVASMSFIIMMWLNYCLFKFD